MPYVRAIEIQVESVRIVGQNSMRIQFIRLEFVYYTWGRCTVALWNHKICAPRTLTDAISRKLSSCVYILVVQHGSPLRPCVQKSVKLRNMNVMPPMGGPAEAARAVLRRVYCSHSLKSDYIDT